MDFISPIDTINAISQHLRTLYKPYAGAQFRFVFLGEGREADRFLALEELAGQLVEELSSYRPLDRDFLAPLFEEFCRAPGKFVRYPEVRKVALDLQNALDRMFAARRDHEDGQPELRHELDAELKELLTACARARKITSE
jgi:hypothetical protein